MTPAARAPRLGAAPLGGVNEHARRRLVALVLVIYLLAIFEGSIRKYVVPQFGQYVFFIRDPFLIYVYVLATRFGFWPRNNGLFRTSLFMCGFGLLLFVLQTGIGGASDTRIVLGVNGWRSYCLYVPLAFLIGEQFRAADLARFAKLTLLLAVPIAVLVSVQFASPPGAAVNVGVAAEEELQFKSVGLDREHIRTTGPFTSNVGQQQFVTTACAFLLALLLLPASRRGVGVTPLMVAAAAILTCVALGGSRGTTLQCAMNVGFALVIGLIGRGAALKAKALALPLSLSAAAIVLYPIVFPTGFMTFMARWEGAARSEAAFEGGVFGRALYGFIDFVRLVDVVPALGYGLGYGSNASITLRAEVDGVMPGFLAETDFSRHMVDLGPAFGLCYIAFRVALVIWLARRVLTATRSVADPLPMMLFAYAGFVLLSGQITGNGTVNIYGWLFAGFCMAATRVALVSARAPAVPLVRAPAPTRRRLPARRSQPNRSSTPHGFGTPKAGR
ncbi:MAG: hypothetical protein V4569_08210 [Pseudomonadota bacterium]